MIYDISPPITSRLQVWPGDTPPSRDVQADFSRGDDYALSVWHTTAHVGAHADAPSHFAAAGRDIAALPIERFIGSCHLIRINAKPGSALTSNEMHVPSKTERLLIATGTYPDPEQFNQDFAGLAPEFVEELHESGVRLIGVDTPSIDPFDAEEHAAHKACARLDIIILEGLVLEGVPAGNYELIALPLKLVGFEASPVRAVLRTVG